MSKTSYDKLSMTLRYWLHGMAQNDKEYYDCIKAMEYAKKYHKGFRKDGITPEFEHQLTIAHYVRTLSPHLIDPAKTLTVAFLHDVPEDYDVSYDELDNMFGRQVADSTFRMSKVFRGVKKSKEEYFGKLGECPISSINKGGDRIHNIQTMVGVFTPDKQKEYIKEAEQDINPMLKIARRNFPEQEMAYENIKLVLNSNMALIKEIHNATKEE